MKISDKFILRNVAGSYIAVPVEEKSVSFNAMITLNETGAFLWETLKDERTEEELIAAVLEEYDIDKDTAQADVQHFLEKLNANSLIVQ